MSYRLHPKLFRRLPSYYPTCTPCPDFLPLRNLKIMTKEHYARNLYWLCQCTQSAKAKEVASLKEALSAMRAARLKGFSTPIPED